MNPTVLFVDDEPQVTRSLAVHLRREPYRVLTASSPPEALAMMGENEVDIVVTDEHMPGMSGNEILARVCETNPATVRIMLTGGGTLATAVQAINSGAVFRYLQKPCSREELLACLAAAAVARQNLLRMVEAQGRAAAVAAAGEQLDRAVAAMWLAVQPIVQPSRRTTFAYEALVRTTEPSVPHGGAFIALAEYAGRMVELEYAIHQRAAVIAAALPPGASLFVNVQPCVLAADWFGSPADPLFPFADRIVLEITEATTAAEIANARPRLAEARRCGFRLALDDVGAGEAGLGILASLHPDIAKLDRELVRDIHTDPARRTLARGLAAICRELEIGLLAEGIEAEEELAVFSAIGVDLYQGYLFARPGRPFPEVSWPAHPAP